jgi:hypothetical protein
MLFSFAFFYICFYFFSRVKIAHSNEEETDREKALNWFVMVPFIFELFVFFWIMLDKFENKSENEND